MSRAPSTEETLAVLAHDPDVGITDDELEKALRDPDFVSELAAAEAQLEAELASAEA